MGRFAVLLLSANCIYAAESTVDIDTAAKIYQAAEVREQVRASLGAMPEHMRQLFVRDVAAQLSDQQLAAVTAAAKRGFRIDVFEAPALRALADNLDQSTVVKVQAFLASDLGKRMVAADVAEAAVGEEVSDKVMNGELALPSTPKRDLLIEKLERATRSTESQVQIYFAMGEAVAIGTAIGSGQDPAGVGERARKTAEASRAVLEESMRAPMRKIMAYGYRNLSDSDLKRMLAFLDSPAGKRFVSAYNASMEAGFSAMGKRTGEQLGEALRELAQAQLEAPPLNPPPPDIAAPSDRPAAPPGP
ncbi:MAG TPA: DUF2059 domain-containing protein [Steroidobacteraceae bacterium]|nr:DUF2059 domain-containing protein [Steroidobacteraceae bacterium]